jgi:transglutaminase-like putative cysteine protease
LKSRVPVAGILCEMIACSQEVAMGRDDPFDLTDKMFVKSPEPITDVHSATSITYTLSPAPGVKLALPSTDNQKVQVLADGRIRLTVEPVAPTGGLLLYKSNNASLLEATRPTRFLQSDREEIVALARRAVGDTTDSVEAARRIEAFVAGYVRNYSLAIGYASAAEVAQSRTGDCTEFAVLTAALCRAVGIPAQVCSGVAYVGSLRGSPGFAGHAWTQAYVGVDAQGKNGKWVGLDATFKSGRLGGYDAGHITLDVGNGEPGSYFNIATFLDQVKIEKVEVQRGR